MVQNIDTQLLHLIAGGNEDAFGTFYKTKVDYVTNVVRKYHSAGGLAVEDLVQEIFLSVWKYRSNLKAVKNIKYYLFKTAKNKVVRLQMSALKKTNLSLDDVQSNHLQQPPQDQLDYKLLMTIYKKTIQSMPGRQQRVFQLRHEAGLSRQEVGAKMGIAPSTVKNLNAAAKQKLWWAMARVVHR